MLHTLIHAGAVWVITAHCVILVRLIALELKNALKHPVLARKSKDES